MTSLRTDLDDYLQLRRRLGHELADAARLLPRYVDYLEQSGQTTITVTNAVTWSQKPQAPPGSSVRSKRMTAVRGFARYLSGIDSATEVPPLGLGDQPPAVASAVHLHRRRHRDVAHRGRGDAVTVAQRDVYDVVRVVGRDRDARR